MALKTSGSLTVTFGMVSIPVKLVAATTDKSIKFNQIDPKTGSRITTKSFSVASGEEVQRADMLKGYEYAKDQYVTFTPAEIKALEEENTHMAEIVEFVPASSVDPIFYDKPYYLSPAPGGAKPYALLLEAMRLTDRVAIGKWVARGKGFMVMLRPAEEGEDAIVMQTLLYADEVRLASEVDVPKAELKPAELELAQKLIEQLAVDQVDPTKYKDEYRARLEDLIQKKIADPKMKIEVAPAKPAAQVVDLMAALSASLKPGTEKSKSSPAKAAKKPVKA